MIIPENAEINSIGKQLMCATPENQNRLLDSMHCDCGGQAAFGGGCDTDRPCRWPVSREKQMKRNHGVRY